ncbi:hypothetical protein [Actinoplanes sp. NPDC049265]|uniref:hypothetical protein n=1 Tax=Actinoplanes sp. NPDC049265 TaxID=3363902 RepID=UPI0037136E29
MGLSEDDVRVVREGLAAGRKPRVQFTESAGQIVGQLGQVVGLTDPAESDDWVVVKFGRDELPFSPADLVIAPKGATPPRKKAPVAEPELQGPPILEDLPASRPAPVVEAVQAEPVTAPAPRKPARPVKAKTPPGLTVTLAYAEGEWLVSAAQGAKTLAKPYVIKPAEAMRMVSLVDVPGVQEAVEQILSAERKEAEQEADRLRAQLAEIESRLAELRDAG